MWSRHDPPPDDPHVERSLRHADPFAIVFWSRWSGDWQTLASEGAADTDDLAAFCEAYGLGVVSAGDVAWLKGESNG